MLQKVNKSTSPCWKRWWPSLLLHLCNTLHRGVKENRWKWVHGCLAKKINQTITTRVNEDVWSVLYIYGGGNMLCQDQSYVICTFCFHERKYKWNIQHSRYIDQHTLMLSQTKCYVTRNYNAVLVNWFINIGTFFQINIVHTNSF